MGETLEVGLGLGWDGFTGVEVETGVLPGVKDLDAFGRQELFSNQ